MDIVLGLGMRLNSGTSMYGVDMDRTKGVCKEQTGRH